MAFNENFAHSLLCDYKSNLGKGHPGLRFDIALVKVKKHIVFQIDDNDSVSCFCPKFGHDPIEGNDIHVDFTRAFVELFPFFKIVVSVAPLMPTLS